MRNDHPFSIRFPDKLSVRKLSGAERSQLPADAGALNAAKGRSRIRPDKVVDEYRTRLNLRSYRIGTGRIFTEHSRAQSELCIVGQPHRFLVGFESEDERNRTKKLFTRNGRVVGQIDQDRRSIEIT
jgi:hypothetical protein